jgi:hypothetical protein
MNRFTRRCILLCLFSLVFGITGVQAAENLISNPSFEMDLQSNGLPPGWLVFNGKMGESLIVESGMAYDGNKALVINDSSDAVSVGMASQLAPGTPGAMYEATAYIHCSPGSKVDLYLDFRDADGKRISAVIVTTTKTNEWEKVVASGRAPEGTSTIRIILYSVPKNVGVIRSDHTSLIQISEASASGSAASILLHNPSFEEGPLNIIPPTGWEIFSGRDSMSIEEGIAYTGKRALVFRDMNASESVGLRSRNAPAEPGDVFTASAWVNLQAGSSVDFYVDFRDKSNQRVSAKIVNNSYTEIWEKLEQTVQAPDGTAYVSVILYSQPKNTGVMYFDEISLEKVSAVQWDAMELEMFSAEDTLDYSPADGSISNTNPPSFVWLPIPNTVSYTLEYSTDPQFAAEATIKVEGLDISIYTPATTISTAQTWYWRVSGVYDDGRLTPPTSVRRFNVASDASILPLPDLNEVRSKIPASHPRLFITKDTIPEWQARAASDKLIKFLWNEVRTKALMASFQPLPNEPPHSRPKGIFDNNLYQQAAAETTQAVDTMELIALVYAMTGDPLYGEAVRRWIMNVTSWDPDGATSADANWDAARPLLQKLARAYTWAYDALSEEERETVRKVVRIRTLQLYQMAKGRKYESSPYASHTTGSLSTIGEVAIAFMGDIPEAEEWFDYIVRIFYAIYPPWGGHSGGWSEGHAYWSASQNRTFWFMDALRIVTELDLYQKPFFKNTGDFKLLTQPPYSKMGPFGDFADVGPNLNASDAMGHLAAVYDNPYYQWYVSQLGATVETGLEGFLRANMYSRTDYKGQPPVDAPSSAYFEDIGWVVFHQDYLAPVNERIQFLFKSSPYGSYSHSMADQNAFTLEAFGEPLAISSGYRPWYGSAHHMGWTKTTQAHNTVLVNGQGQIVQSLKAKGEIINFLGGESISYTSGAAHTAYGMNLLDKFVRHVVYLRPDVFVIYDDLQAPKPSSYTWLMHAYQKMSIDPSGQGFTLKTAGADLKVNLWANTALEFSQTDQFAVSLDEPMDKPIQWHLKATTAELSSDAYFMAVLQPLNKDVAINRDVQLLSFAAGQGVRISDENAESLVLYRKHPGVLASSGLTANGEVAVWSRATAGAQSMMLVSGDSWEADNGVAFTATTPVNVELTFAANKVTGSIATKAVPGSQPYDVTLRVPGKHVSDVVAASGMISWQVEEDSVKVTLQPGEHRLEMTLK